LADSPLNANHGGAVSATHCTATPRSDERDDLIAEIGRGEIDLLTQIALVSIIWQKRSCMPLPGL
jgi:hypothetical protein